MASLVNLANFSPAEPETGSIYDIGRDSARTLGVLGEIALMYSHNLADTPDIADLEALLGRIVLLGEVALVDNRARDLDVSSSGLSAVQSWVARSALLKSVRRMFDITQPFPDAFDAAAITGHNLKAVLNRTKYLRDLWNTGKLNFDSVLLVAGDLTLAEDRRESIILGETVEEVDILQEIARRFNFEGYRCAIYRRQPDKRGFGSDVETYEGRSIVVMADSGQWIQDAGRLLRVFKHDSEGRFNITGGSLGVYADTGITDSDITTLVTETSMVGYTLQIVEAAAEFQRHRQLASS